MPTIFDVLIQFIDTMFCVVEAELKEIISEKELENIKNRAVIYYKKILILILFIALEQ